MHFAQARAPRRSAYTFVELLVVVAIIAILVSLTAAAVFKALAKGPEAQARNDISQLALAVTTFEGDFKVPYLPSRLRLYKRISPPSYNMNNAYEVDSFQYLVQMWPRLRGRPYTQGDRVRFYWVDWDGTGNPPVNSDPAVDLEGEQCLVFFLGGIPARGATPGTQGFSTDEFDPSQPPAAAAAPRKGPYFEFKPNRLQAWNNTPFYAYLDAFGQAPYAYFSSYKTASGYERYHAAFGTSDCGSLGVSPYADLLPNPPSYAAPPPRYLNPSTFQIVSAGADGVFGRGSCQLPKGGAGPTVWTPGTPLPTWSPVTAGSTPATAAFTNGAVPTPAQLAAGRDDLSNFHPTFLGMPLQ